MLKTRLDGGAALLMMHIFALLVLGLFVLYSASHWEVAVVERQALRMGLGLLALLALARLNPRHYHTIAYGLFWVTLGLLVLVLVMGSSSKGAQRWLSLGVFRFQPSELMKIAVPLMLARFLTHKGLPASPLRILMAFALLLIPVLLIAKQPDLGTSILVFASGFMAIFLSGLPWWWMAGMAGLLSGVCPLIWPLLHDYQRERIWTFLDPERDPLGSGYNIIQSKIALGSGGWWGKGFGQGPQAHLDFLPEHTTDFIFAVFGEEFGLLGTWCLLILYASLLWQCYKMSLMAKDSFCRVLSGTLTFTFAVYVVVNIGMVSGALPVVGVPLPLISYGGTSLLSLLAAFGIIMATTTRPSWTQL